MIPDEVTLVVKDKEGLSDTTEYLDRSMITLIITIAVLFYLWWGLL